MATVDEAARVVKSVLDTYQSKRTILAGLLGNGSGVVAGGRSNTVLVRMGNKPPVELYNYTVPPHNDFPVLIGYPNHQSTRLEVLGPDSSRLSDWADAASNTVPLHGETHHLGSATATVHDIVYVDKRQFMPLMVQPTDPPSMSVRIQGDYYQFDNAIKYCAGLVGGPSDNLGDFRPQSADIVTLVTLFIDAPSGTVVVKPQNFQTFGQSEEAVIQQDFALGVPTKNLPASAIPLGAVVLTSVTRSIGFNDILDIRPLLKVSSPPISATFVENLSGHDHGTTRLRIASGTTTVNLFDVAETLETVTFQGFAMDPLAYSLANGGTQLQLTSATVIGGIMEASYVISQR